MTLRASSTALSASQVALFNGNTFGPANVRLRSGTFAALMALDGNADEIASCTDYTGVLVKFDGNVDGARAIYPQGGIAIDTSNTALWNGTNPNGGISVGDYSKPYVNRIHIRSDCTDTEMTLPSFSATDFPFVGDGEMHITLAGNYTAGAAVILSGDGWNGSISPGDVVHLALVYDEANVTYSYAYVSATAGVSGNRVGLTALANQLASASAVALTATATPKTIFSFSLAPGQNIILDGSLGYKPQGTTVCTHIKARLSTTTNSFSGTDELGGFEIYASIASTGNSVFQLAPIRVSNTTGANVTYYLVVEAAYTVAAPSFYGSVFSTRGL